MQDARSELIDLIWAAVEEPSGWSRFLEGFAQPMRAAQASFFLSHSEQWAGSISVTTGVDPEDLRLYLERWAVHDPWMTRMQLPQMPCGTVVPSQTTCPDEELEASAIYREFLGPRQWHYGGGVMIEREPGQISGMSMLRPKELGPLNGDETELWQSLVPHLQRAVRMHGERARLRAERDILMRHFDAAGAGLLLVNGSGTVLMANAGARALLEAGSGLRLEDNGRVVAVDPAGAARLAAAIEKGGAQVALPRPGGQAPLLVRVEPCRGPDAVSALHPAAVLTLIDVERPVEIRADVLEGLFGLSDEEAGLARRVAAGEDVGEEQARILERCGCESPAALAAVVMRARSV